MIKTRSQRDVILLMGAGLILFELVYFGAVIAAGHIGGDGYTYAVTATFYSMRLTNYILFFGLFVIALIFRHTNKIFAAEIASDALEVALALLFIAAPQLLDTYIAPIPIWTVGLISQDSRIAIRMIGCGMLAGMGISSCLSALTDRIRIWLRVLIMGAVAVIGVAFFAFALLKHLLPSPIGWGMAMIGFLQAFEIWLPSVNLCEKYLCEQLDRQSVNCRSEDGIEENYDDEEDEDDLEEEDYDYDDEE